MTIGNGARGGRTLKVFPPEDFKSSASADSAIAPAAIIVTQKIVKRDGVNESGREKIILADRFEVRIEAALYAVAFLARQSLTMNGM